MITGALGFIGSRLLRQLYSCGRFQVRGLTRAPSAPVPQGIELVSAGDLANVTHWRPIVDAVDVVVHTAAKVHDRGQEADAYRRVNELATQRLAREAAAAGVKRFVFLSSIKVNGEQTRSGSVFHAEDPPSPEDDYARSKFRAEIGLREVAEQTPMQIVVIRPPLVYGPGVKANFLSLMRWLNRRIPLPLGAVHNRRSLVALDNLVDLIVTCVEHPAAANQTFLVSDGEDLSTPDLMTRLGEALGKPARLIPVPASVLRTAAGLAGRHDVFNRVCGSLQVDITKNREMLSWTPRFNVDEALRITARHYLQHQA